MGDTPSRVTAEEEQRQEQDREQELHEGVHHYSAAKDWVRPDNPVTLERLEWFKDQKLALMMHWGPYSQLGIVESWALSDEDADWSREGIDWETDADAFKEQYRNLNRTFNPVRLQPEQWAELAADNGFRYLIFTTKHHDGFCMWDTATTDYRITGADSPFRNHRYADICKHVFQAFRDKGLAIAAYFSKADWNTPHYWAPGMNRSLPTWRGPSYDPQENPELWEQFVSFTHNQLDELLNDYGRIDILWLDAGWVREGRLKQNIRLGEAVERARAGSQPWLLSADRTVGGPYENYVTPEQTIPPKPLTVPWESCITMGTSFSFRYEDEYKSARQLVHMLLEVVAKGGNLALNVGPQPDGRLPEGAVRRIKELGAWLSLYGEAIYGTRICEPYYTGEFAFTRKGDTVYAACLYREDDSPVKEWIELPYAGPVSVVELMGTAAADAALEWERTETGIKVRLPASELGGRAPIAHMLRLK